MTVVVEPRSFEENQAGELHLYATFRHAYDTCLHGSKPRQIHVGKTNQIASLFCATRRKMMAKLASIKDPAITRIRGRWQLQCNIGIVPQKSICLSRYGR